jgi:signal recognition particle GTPase
MNKVTETIKSSWTLGGIPIKLSFDGEFFVVHTNFTWLARDRAINIALAIFESMTFSESSNMSSIIKHAEKIKRIAKRTKNTGNHAQWMRSIVKEAIESEE